MIPLTHTGAYPSAASWRRGLVSLSPATRFQLDRACSLRAVSAASVSRSFPHPSYGDPGIYLCTLLAPATNLVSPVSCEELNKKPSPSVLHWKRYVSHLPYCTLLDEPLQAVRNFAFSTKLAKVRLGEELMLGPMPLRIVNKPKWIRFLPANAKDRWVDEFHTEMRRGIEMLS